MSSLLALFTLAFTAYLLSASILAHCLFNELGTLKLGHSTFEDAERLANKIHADPEPYGPCSRSECEWNKRIDNASLPLWWRGSGVVFIVSFTVKDTIVVRKDIGYAIGIDGAVHPSQVELEEKEQWGPLNLRGPVQAGWQISDVTRLGSSDSSRYYWFRVRMNPNASAEERRRYTSFDFNCFWKYKGCKDARELLPTADPYPSDK